MARYSIDGQILTALGDAVRGKTGETEYRDVTYTSKPYHFDADIYDNSNYLYIPVMGATTIKITKLATTADPSNTLYLGYCSAIDIGRYPQVRLDEFTLYDFTSDQCGIYTIGSGWTYDFEATWYDADGNVMEVVINSEVLKTMTPERMADEINALPVAPTVNDLVLTGSCSNRFYGGGWDWLIEKYGNMITSNKIYNTNTMFAECNVDIPFEINCDSTQQTYMGNMFQKYKGNTIPMVHTAKPSTISNFASEANNVREFPEGFAEDWDWSVHTSGSGLYTGPKQEMFGRCYSLRKLPMELLKYGNPNINVTYNQFYGMCKYCASLDEIVDLPNPHIQSVWNNSSAYNQAFKDMLVGCYRLKNFTFAEMEPVSWALQTLDLSQAGYGSSDNEVILYNSGITTDKKVSDDVTYQALKDDPDWYTLDYNYSRYNHDSAVATINSLPDCSVYQTSSGKGANTIKFKGAAGSATDGGAINTLTEEEIAVAAAKGWTVAFA